MESIALPQDLYWDGKLEPISPTNSEMLPVICEDLNDNWLSSNYDFENDIIIISQEDIELKHHDVDLVEALLADEDLIMEFNDLKDENLYSPTSLLDSSIENAIVNPTQAVKVLPEINHFGFANHNASAVLTQLTPPSSPPQTTVSPLIPPVLETVTSAIGVNNGLQQLFKSSEPASPNSQVQTSFGFNNWNNNNHQHSTTNEEKSEDDIAFHTQIINDILKSAADKIFEEGESQSSISGPPSQADYTDDEWQPSSGSCSPLPLHHHAESSSESCSGSSSPVPTKKRTRPYGRGVEDRKIRKKEQNKNAATRYRQKKKLEMEYILIEEQELNKRHEELKLQLAERKREAKYLRTLIREFYSKKKI
uniref:BZIP domain-containing protein n=2 Tax=Stomoxys calcitrans TaxID=35570 RepID=A0A1I8QEL1_STOCA